MMRRFLKALLVFLAFILLIFYIKCPRTQAFKDDEGNVIEGSIATLEKIELGGCEQWILIRGKNKIIFSPLKQDSIRNRKYKNVK